MRRLALLALIVPLTAGCGFANLLLSASYGHAGAVTVPLIHVTPPVHRGCMAIGPDGTPRPCVNHGHIRHGPMFRSCGEVGVGIGWHLSVHSMSCHAGTTLVHRYFSGRNSGPARTVLGYTCAGDTFHVSCQRDGAMAVFYGNH
jgi:hypothetical protein